MLKILRRASYRATPWKNGGGITHEVLRSPDGEMFDFRVSVARIERDGPFSHFPSHVRHMALLQGDGVRLRFSDHEQTLSQVGALIEFDGAAAVHCELLGGACTDLNLMVARHLSAEVTVLPLGAPLELAARAGRSVLLFNLGAPVTLAAASAPQSLGSWDCMLLEDGEATLVPGDGERKTTPSTVFFATIWHGSKS